MGRVMGHGMGILFMGLGLVFLVAALNDSFTSWIDANSTCTSGNCGTSSVRTTFMILGASFFAGGLLTSVITEFAIRKTRKVMAEVTTFAASPHTPENLSEFLSNFGIDMDASKAKVSVERPVALDLRNLRNGSDVPTDPAGLSNYLKSLGITIDEERLKHASIFAGGQQVQSAAVSSNVPAQAGAGGPSAFTSPAASPGEGARETATIVRKKDRGATAGNQRLLELEIEVTPVGKVPYRVTVPSLVRESLAGLLIDGSSLNVRVDPHDKNNVTIDWSEN
jgi:hypothetical protein